jgi:hypothetical protein
MRRIDVFLNSVGSAIERLTERAKKSSFRTRLSAALGVVVTVWAVPYFAPGIWATIKHRAGQDPIRITVTHGPVSYVTHADNQPAFLIPKPIEQIPVPPIEAEKRYQWAAKLEGIESEVSVLQVLIEGRSSSPVILQDLRIRVLSRDPPPSGSLIVYENFSVGSETYERRVRVDLDRNPPLVGASGWKFPLRVSENDIESFYVLAHAEAYDSTWVADLYYVSDGKRNHVTIQDGDEPFRTTSPGNAPVYKSNDGKSFR